MNKDLLESVLSVSEAGTRIGASAQDGIRAFVAEAAGAAQGSPGLDELRTGSRLSIQCSRQCTPRLRLYAL